MSEIIHGGDIKAAMVLAQKAGFDAGRKEDWLDLSTGVNPEIYPFSPVKEELWHHLPGQEEMQALSDAAVRYYGAPDANHLTPAPGSALLIQMLPHLLGVHRKIAIVSPTYGDHQAAWERSSARVRGINTLENAVMDEVTVIVNPNNPDGRCFEGERMRDLARRITDAGGWLIVDEAFGDLAPEKSLARLTRDHNLVVLKSVGKFFGLAGLRLGFAISRPDLCARLSEYLGAWPVSGPALVIGAQALSDHRWQLGMRQTLAEKSGRLNALLQKVGLSICGGTSLFTLVDDERAPLVFNRLLAHKIYVRRFDYNPDWLRIGLPGAAHDFARLEEALSER